MTITVIFGAGASYDSDRQISPRYGEDPTRSPDAFLRPPLATNLFDRNEVTGPILDTLPVLQSAATRLSGLQGVGVEDELGRLQDEAATDPVRAQQLVAARLYLRASLRQISESWSGRCHGLTSYSWLNDVLHGVRQQTGDDLCYVTFNYDRLLDEAVERLYGVRFGSVGDYVDAVPGVEVHKLHGSLDWVWPRPDMGDWASGNPDVQARSLLLAGAVNRSADEGETFVVERADHRSEFRRRRRSTGLVAPMGWIVPHVPALAIPVRKKYSLVLPEVLVERMKRRLEATTRLIVIGWRAQEDHVLGLLRDHLRANRATLVVDRDMAEAAVRARTLVDAAVPVGEVVTARLGFSDLRAEEITTFLTKVV